MAVFQGGTLKPGRTQVNAGWGRMVWGRMKKTCRVREMEGETKNPNVGGKIPGGCVVTIEGRAVCVDGCECDFRQERRC